MRLTSLLTLLLLLVFPFGQLTRIPLIWPEATIYLHDVLIIGLLLLQLREIPNVLSKYRAFIGFVITALFALFLASATIPINQLLISSFYLIRWVGYSLIGLLWLENRDPWLNKKLPTYILLSIGLSVFAGIFQYLAFPRLEPLFAAGWDRHYYRLAGTWLDANYTALLFGLFLLWILDKMILKGKQVRDQAWGIAGVLVCSGIALLLTYSRSGYLAFLGGLATYFLLRKPLSRKVNWHLSPALGMGLGFCVLFLALILLLPRTYGESTNLARISTITARLHNYQENLHLITSQPLFGYGFNTLRYVKHQTGLLMGKWQTTHSGAGFDNSILFLIATTGFMGFLQFISFGKQLITVSPNKHLFSASLVTVLISSFFNNALFYPWVLLWLYIVLGEKKANSNTKQ